MKSNEEKDRLLDDILGGEDAGWRDGALAQVRRVARRRRLVRRARHVTASLIVVAAVAVTLRFYDKPAPETRIAESLNSVTIHSAPLPPSIITRSTRDGFALVRTLEAPAQLVRTESGDNLPKQIDDDELLRLAGDSAILVRHAPGEARLVLSDSARARSLFSVPLSDTEN